MSEKAANPEPRKTQGKGVATRIGDPTVKQVAIISELFMEVDATQIVPYEERGEELTAAEVIRAEELGPAD